MVHILNQPPPKPIRGWISTFKVNHKGKKLGPYHVRCYKFGRAVRKQYIKAKDLDYYVAACQAYRDQKKTLRQKTKEYNNRVDNWKYLWTMMERIDKGVPIEQEHIDHIERIHKHGCHVEGRPSLRKKIFMDPFFTNLWMHCHEHGLAYRPIALACTWEVPLDQIEIDLRKSKDPEVERQQMIAVHDAFARLVCDRMGL
jgi:hypothetical protein